MKEFAVVTDSASDISPEIAREYNISIIPIYINYNGKEYRDGVDIDSNKINRLQKKNKALFSSSSPAPHDFMVVYEKLLKEYKNIFSIHISSKLSATIKSAIIARDLLRAENKIKVFDSLAGTMGTGFMVLAAAKAAMKKYPHNKILRILKYLRKNIRLYGTIDTLKYLRRSGRVPAIANFMSRLLTIKPLLGINEGVVGIIGVSVTRYWSLREITRRVKRDFKGERWVIVSIIHTLSLKESKIIIRRLQSSLNMVDSMITACTPVIGAHTGPGLIGIIVTRLNRETADLFIHNAKV